jgi:serine/threonine protein phosphatase PrpC
MESKLVLPAVEFAQRTDPGRDPDKQVNEDACGYEETPLGHLSVLCDGMGGHQNGREAAQLAVKTIFEAFARAPTSGPASFGSRGRELLHDAILAANARVSELGGLSKQSRPGSTVVAMLMHPEGVEVAHVGDSRCYLVQGGQIFQLTKDHTVVQKMVDAQMLTPAQAAVHPDANQILRALGTSPTLEIEVRAQSLPLVLGDAFVLCSDGLSDLVGAEELLRIVLGSPPAQAVGQLVDLANARGGHDNITVLILRGREAPVSLREPAPTLAQTLFEAPAMPMLQAASEVAGLAVAPLPVAPPPTPPLALPPAPPLVPPAASPAQRPRRMPVAVVLGVLLAVVGFGAAGFLIYLLLDPTRDAKQVAPFALSGAPLVNPPPSVALVPVAPEPPPPAVDGGPPAAPLPSLQPPRSLRHGHGS